MGGNILFADAEHREFYTEQTAKLMQDCYHRALIYTLGICSDTRRRFDSIYDVKDRSINPEAINAEWQTGGSMKVTRLAFNLFTDGTPTACWSSNSGDVAKDIAELTQYSVSDIFCCSFAPYFFEAIKIRYPEYLRGGDR